MHDQPVVPASPASLTADRVRKRVRVRLLGRPSIEVDGSVAPGPRGRKAWALLAVLLLAEVPPSRRSLTGLLFPDADDPSGALRWTMSQLRRGLAGQVTAEGDPVVLRLGPACRVDVVDLLDGEVPGPDDPSEPLLADADAVAGPDFALWLTAARHRVDAARARRLRGRAERALAAGDASAAVSASARAVTAEPDNPHGRAALIGSLVAAGDHTAALAQLRDWGAWIRRELRVADLLGGPRRPGPTDTDTLARVQAGKAALAAGAVTAGLEHLRDAVRLAAGRRDERVRAAALFALGSGLVHSVAPHCVEASDALRESAALARRTGERRLAAEALRDLAYVENAAGRSRPAHRLLADAAAAAGDDGLALSAVHGIEGMFVADRGQHGRAVAVLGRSAELAESAGRYRQVAWALSISCRSLIQREDWEAAADQVHHGALLVAEQRWIPLQPYFDTMRAELDLAQGRVADAEQRLRGAWSLSLVLGDWCWQSLAARGRGLAAFARGDVDRALRWLDEAARRAEQPHDRYAWIRAWVQDAACRVTTAAGLPRADNDVSRLAALAAQANLPDFVIRADLHRADLHRAGLDRDGLDRAGLDRAGARGRSERAAAARERARALVATIDNPALTRLANRRVATAR